MSGMVLGTEGDREDVALPAWTQGSGPGGLSAMCLGSGRACRKALWAHRGR